MKDIVNKLRLYAEDLHSDGGFNGYAQAMSIAADEIEGLRGKVKALEEDVITYMDQRDELGADKATWFRMSEIFCKQAAEYKKQVEELRWRMA